MNSPSDQPLTLRRQGYRRLWRRGSAVFDRALRAFTLLIGGVLLVYHPLYFTQQGIRTVRWMRAGELSIDLKRTSLGGPVVINSIDSLTVKGPLPSPGDTVVALGSILARADNAALACAASTPRPHMPVELRFRRGGAEKITLVISQPLPLTFGLYVLSIQVLRFLVSMGYVVVGLWAILTKPRVAAVRAVALFAFSMAALIIAALRVGEIEVVAPGFSIPGEGALHGGLRVLQAFFGAFWLNFHLLFPRPLIMGTRRSTAAHGLVYAPVVALILLGDRLGPVVDSYALLFLQAIQLLAGFGIVLSRRRRDATLLERRQLSLVAHGSAIGLAGYGLLICLNLIPGLRAALAEVPEMLLLFACLLLMLAAPASFAYAFGKYRLLDVEARLRREARRILVTAVLLVLLLAALYGVTVAVLRLTGSKSPVVTLSVALLCALGFAPLYRRMQALVERRFYPERARLRYMIDGLLSSTTTAPDRPTFVTLLQDGLKESLGTSSATVAQRLGDGFHLASGVEIPVRAGGRLTSVLECARPLMVDELIATRRIDPMSDEGVWLVEERIGVVLPFIVHGRVTGFAALGSRADGEDFRAGDLSLLVALASRMALELENLRLLEEAIERHRLAEQLAMARRVQERFLPKDLPPTPGLEIAAQCLFSLEVAGDYYDVMALENGRTLLAVADVSGKGAGAAMIMSNLRASLRALALATSGLGGVVSRLNSMICHDVETGQFITFFVGVFDPASRWLTYVNAGHNPPRIMRRQGNIEALPPTGRVLGVTPVLSYGEASCQLAAGDLLVAYTDGVTEAMNEHEDEFGDERLDALIRDARSEPPQAIVGRILAAVDHHAGREARSDDCTLLVARVV